MSDMWIVENPGLNAIGVADPRLNPEHRNDLQVKPGSFVVVGKEDIDVWRMSPAFVRYEQQGKLRVEKVTELPKPRPTLPKDLNINNSFHNQVAREIALSPQQDVQMARIDLFKSDQGSTEDWREDADITYLKSVHKRVLTAAQWWLTTYVEKLSADQKARLAAIKRQLAAIKRLG